MTEVEIATVARDLSAVPGIRDDPRADWYPGFFDDEQETRAWEDRRRTTLTVADDETLNDIFTRAVASLGIYEADWSTWDPEPKDPLPEPNVRTRRFMALRYDESPLPLLERLSVDLTIPDDDGLAHWARWHYEVTYAELRHAAAACAVNGDPTQIYLLVRPDAAGGGILNSWEVLIQAWDEAIAALLLLAAANETHDLYVKVRDRLAGRRVVRRKTKKWLKRRGNPDYFKRMFQGEAWAPRDLAGLLGCTVEEAEDVLALYGYAAGLEGEWLYAAGTSASGIDASAALSARVVVVYAEEVLLRYADSRGAPSDELVALFNEIFTQASERGEVGYLGHVPYDSYRWDADQHSRISWRVRNAVSRWTWRFRTWRYKQ